MWELWLRFGPTLQKSFRVDLAAYSLFRVMRMIVVILGKILLHFEFT